nr:F-box domain, cyclin-like protein [Ipomoea batatas]
MESHRNFATNTIGFCLLPSELIQHIILRLALPETIRLKTVNKSIFSTIISDEDFARDYNLLSSSATWLFVYRKRWRRDAVLHGFTGGSDRWFKILIGDMLKPVIPPGEDVYFLTASGNIFLFALNTSQEVISVDILTRVVKKIPPSPLGPRGTSSWRRSGMKLLSCPHETKHFRFFFAEICENGPVLFEYDSKIDKWHSWEAEEVIGDLPHSLKRDNYIFLSASNSRLESTIIATGPQHDKTMILRPRYVERENEGGHLVVGFSWRNAMNRLHVYGDANMLIAASENACGTGELVRMLKGIELWGLSSNGRRWELVSRLPNGLIDKIRKPYGAMMGCMQERDGIIRAILMSNLEGSWNIIWLSYDKRLDLWEWLPLPDSQMKGSNLAGITFSSGLTLS